MKVLPAMLGKSLHVFVGLEDLPVYHMLKMTEL